MPSKDSGKRWHVDRKYETGLALNSRHRNLSLFQTFYVNVSLKMLVSCLNMQPSNFSFKLRRQSYQIAFSNISLSLLHGTSLN